MPRPSQQIDLALLASGQALYPQTGAAGLTVRALAEHAGVNPAMFHYHFAHKEAFLQALLRRMYEEMFGALSANAGAESPPLLRLRAALLGMADFARSHRGLLARLLSDAIAGEPVATAFLRQNAPRHLGLLRGLVDQAVQEGALQERPRLQQMAVLLGGVLLPIIFVGGLFDALALPQWTPARFGREVMDPAATAQRIDLLLSALGASLPVEASAVADRGAGTSPAAAGRPRRRAAAAGVPVPVPKASVAGTGVAAGPMALPARPARVRATRKPAA